MNLPPRLPQLISDERVGALFAAPKPGLALDDEGNLLLANRAALTLLRTGSVADAAAVIAAERGRIAATLRQLVEGPANGPAQKHALAFLIGGARKAVEFACSRVALAGGGAAILLVGSEPAGIAPDPISAASAFFDHAYDAFALIDDNGRRIYANSGAAALLGPAEKIEEVIPAAHRELAIARREGYAEFSFGVLRILLRRVGSGSEPLFIVAFTAPARDEVKFEAEPIEPEEISQPTEPVHAVPAPAPEDQPKPEPEAPGTVTPTQSEAPKPRSEPPAEPEKHVPRSPGRFVWQTDADGRFTSVSPELAAVVGHEPAAVAGTDWQEAAARIGIEGADEVVSAVARRDTWSGVTVTWPVEGGEWLRPIDLAALPVFDRERRFLGFRGFGVFRDAVARPQPAKGETRAPVAEKPAPPKFAPIVRPPDRPAAPPPPTAALVEKLENVVPLHKGPASDPARPTLTPVERNAFREIAKVIGSRMKRVDAPAAGRDSKTAAPAPSKTSATAARATGDGERAVLDRLPIGVIVHRGEKLLYANRTLLDWVGFTNIEELAHAGGLGRLFSTAHAGGIDEEGNLGRLIALRSRGGEPIPVEARLLSAPWEGEAALMYVLRRAGAGLDERIEAGELALREAEGTARELRAILDTATDGVALLDCEGRVLGMNRSAEALFGFDSGEIEGRNFATLFAPESHRAAADYLDGLVVNGVASVLNDGREVIGRVREGGLIPLFMTLGRVGEGGDKFCAVFRDITQWKRAEEELVHARRQAERANSAKSDFLAKISHEIRTPLNAIIGFAEVMMEERLGPILNERYREYLKDIHASGEHLVSLINDLLDLSKIEAGKLDLAFASVDLNEIASQSMALMQPQANRERIIIRTALSPDLPPVVADARSVRQIVLNLLSNSIRFTPPGGQVIVSTTLTDDGEVHLRVRDTGIGMTESEIKTALEPFRQITTAGRGKAGGTGLGLPLTKALVEANRASFSIRSTVNSGTLVEVAFPSTRVLAE
ncbi:MAG: PAS domain S-box protein [Xanthobacteraceae bacterium]